MENNQTHNQHTGKSIAFCGIMVAVSVVAMLLGSYLSVAAYACTAGASLLILIIQEEWGFRHAIVSYVCVSILGILFVPYRRIVLLFVLLVGYYPLVKTRLERIQSKILQLAGKLLLCNGTMVFLFYGTVKLIYTGQLFTQVGQYAKAAAVLFVLLGNVAFLCYDFALTKILRLYRQILRPKLRKITGYGHKDTEQT